MHCYLCRLFFSVDNSGAAIELEVGAAVIVDIAAIKHGVAVIECDSAVFAVVYLGIADVHVGAAACGDAHDAAAEERAAVDHRVIAQVKVQNSARACTLLLGVSSRDAAERQTGASFKAEHIRVARRLW